MFQIKLYESLTVPESVNFVLFKKLPDRYTKQNDGYVENVDKVTEHGNANHHHSTAAGIDVVSTVKDVLSSEPVKLAARIGISMVPGGNVALAVLDHLPK